MTNVIIIGILVIFVFIGLSSTIKHFAGKGGCCGGGSSVKIKKKKLSRIVAKKVIFVEGMTCKHCKARVEEVVNDIQGVSGSVNLKKGEVLLSFENEITDKKLTEIYERIRKAGYSVK